MSGIPSSDEKHDDRDRGDEEDRAEVRLESQKEHDRTEQRHIGQISSFERMDFGSASFEKIREVQYASELDEFDRLQRKR